MYRHKKLLKDKTLERDKRIIIALFKKKVKGRLPNVSSAHIDHAGKGGHWLEKQMGVQHNSNNAPDLFDFEMKNETTNKTTFGDWSPDYRVYKKGNGHGLDRTMFLEIFGAPNPLKEDRHSWSGKPSPKVGRYNTFGQKLVVDKVNNISAVYSYSKDTRPNKSKIVPKSLQRNNLVLAVWSAERMRQKVERKFNKRGWFKCIKVDGRYTEIVFGAPITFEKWVEGVRKGLIFFDSGMYVGNPRPYATWRADNRYWNNLITERY